jgi:hypothetical protein
MEIPPHFALNRMIDSIELMEVHVRKNEVLGRGPAAAGGRPARNDEFSVEILRRNQYESTALR